MLWCHLNLRFYLNSACYWLDEYLGSLRFSFVYKWKASMVCKNKYQSERMRRWGRKWSQVCIISSCDVHLEIVRDEVSKRFITLRPLIYKWDEKQSNKRRDKKNPVKELLHRHLVCRVWSYGLKSLNLGHFHWKWWYYWGRIEMNCCVVKN